MANGKRQSMLLVEIVIAVLFFALSATVILDVFAAAYTQSAAAGALSEATADAQDLAERLKAAPGPWDAALEAEGFSAGADGAYALERENYALRVALGAEETGAGTLYTATIDALRGDGAILSLEAARYAPDGEVAP